MLPLLAIEQFVCSVAQALFKVSLRQRICIQAEKKQEPREGLEQLTKSLPYALLALPFDAHETHPLACLEREDTPVYRAWRGEARATAGQAMACPLRAGAYAFCHHVF